MADRIRSLQDSAVAAVISNLGELAASNECCVSCGGTIPEVKSVDIVYKKENGGWSFKPLQLPADLADEKLQEFFGSCSDDTYLDALKLEPECFHASFEIANTFVLDYIYRIMSLSSPIRAELCMLNVYSTGGHFKSHVDTPRSKDMFGSLVVCLPSEFTGGALVTRHQGREVTFDWSSSTTTHWAAFFSDVEHEVLPVTSGHRITLTYNLHCLPSGTGTAVGGIDFHPVSLDVTTNPLYQELLTALQNPHFMREGGTLGFCLRHKYTDPSADLEAFSLSLKGCDAVIYRTVKALQLSISLKPLVCNQQKNPVLNFGDGGNCNYVLPTFPPHKAVEDCGDDFCVVRRVFDDLMKVTGITWMQPPEIFVPLLSVLGEVPMFFPRFGGCSYTKTIFPAEAYYQAPTFLIEVPKFTSQRGYIKTLYNSDGGVPPAKKAAERPRCNLELLSY